ncbi:cobalamin biosynthesis protein [Streptomyces sulphureus]|uniref:cobalamin biosynthesis protein n=1 Tax=Streptomyces sulphureus TaxID=47758 RepID=UPI00037E57A4|nr:cobalamin biosynthesis protein [Streptomyces sulphureus]
MTTHETASPPPPVPVTIGVGGCRDVAGDEVLALVHHVLALAGAVEPCALATVEGKEGEPGLLAAARALGVPLRAYGAAELAAVPGVAVSATARAAFGTASVAEAAALLGAVAPYGAVGAARLLVPKTRSAAHPARATAAVAAAATGERRVRTD